jgi:methionine sulfoxide reductase heme-binding subunit
MAGRKPLNTWLLIMGVVVALSVAGGVVALDPLTAPVEGLLRMGAILGYLTVFLATVSSNYMRELTRYFGRAFVKVHHVASVTALVALLVQVASVAWRVGNLSVFVPVLCSVRAFFSQGGRVALPLLLIAAAVAVFRKKIGKRWKTLHWLNYVAFFLGTIHAQMIGRNFQHLGVRILSIVMAVGVVSVFLLKRRTEVRRKQQRRSRA